MTAFYSWDYQLESGVTWTIETAFAQAPPKDVDVHPPHFVPVVRAKPPLRHPRGHVEMCGGTDGVRSRPRPRLTETASGKWRAWRDYGAPYRCPQALEALRGSAERRLAMAERNVQDFCARRNIALVGTPCLVSSVTAHWQQDEGEVMSWRRNDLVVMTRGSGRPSSSRPQPSRYALSASPSYVGSRPEHRNQVWLLENCPVARHAAPEPPLQ